ncbi:MFS Git1p-related glycerophosphoinositol and glycerophosphocholine permease [Coniophora puteana RWD-64-598 SS2]|uniref:MFS Git1p-related glycerophosphoinositol and glycerophosphocholine permease n=1 Tax=Coniophora puteana (strain RWD-64-598) TaxID=741705 RepID=A0A5M3MY25_CONPW|nr:MFS Git1p-related glycerophosphoinositol and glycerophosphocholine permease [Coniophora puteana RWD-64-598 SS2]EIW83999.1 MFS Git1p-related glycerophosphoinositol and glycerophosphocholine permease [Coniophora puteana RWD-64-598 SS2]
MAEVVTRPKLKQISLIFACGTALFSDGYANNVIGSVNTFLKRIYGDDALTGNNYSNTLSSVAFAGTVVGMLAFGWISDKLGRKFGMMSATAIVAFFSLLSAASAGAHNSLSGLVGMLSFCRFMLGIGVGAEYPCGSVSASEQSEEEGVAKNAQHRWLVLATNTMIDVGFVIGAFVPLVLYWIFRDDHLRAAWRVSLGLGFIPAMAVFFWRLKMEEPTRYKKSSMKNVRIPYGLIFKRYWRGFLGISLSWFIYDFITYPFGIYSSTITDAITGGNSSLSVVFGWSVVINLFYIPGTVIGAFSIDFLGPKATMITGLLAQAVMGFIMSGLYTQLSHHVGAFAVVYGIFLSFGEFGPGNCLGVLAAKTGPTAVRGQYYGAAAAIGKIGAFIGTWVFPIIIDGFGGTGTTKGDTGPFWIASGLAVLSAIVVILLVKPLTADGMTMEDEKFREYLMEHGFDISTLGIQEVDTTDSEVDVKSTEEKVATA